MDEGDLRAAYTRARLLVDQPHACCPQRVQRAGDVVDAVGHWCSPGPRLARKRPTGVSSPSGASSSTWLSPTSSSAASTPCSAIVSRWTAACRSCRGGRRSRRRGPRRRPRCGRCCRTPGRVYPQRPCASPSPPTARQAAGSIRSRSPGAAFARRGGRRVRLGDEDLEQAAAWEPDRLAVAGGDGTIGPVAERPAGSTCRWPCCRPARRTTSRAPRPARRPARGRGAGRVGQRHAAARARPAGRRAAVRQRGQRGPGVGGRPQRAAAQAAARPAGLRRRRASAAARERPLAVTVRADGSTVFDAPAWQVIVAVSGAFGGGCGVAEADPDDGALDLSSSPPAPGRARPARLGPARRRSRSSATCARAGSRGGGRPPGRRARSTSTGRSAGGLERVTVEAGAFRLVVHGPPPARTASRPGAWRRRAPRRPARPASSLSPSRASARPTESVEPIRPAPASAARSRSARPAPRLALEHERELVAADPEHAAAGRRGGSQQPGHRAQDVVAAVTAGVVEALKPSRSAISTAKLRPPSGGGRQRLVEGGVVAEPGERRGRRAHAARAPRPPCAARWRPGRRAARAARRARWRGDAGCGRRARGSRPAPGGGEREHDERGGARAADRLVPGEPAAGRLVDGVGGGAAGDPVADGGQVGGLELRQRDRERALGVVT